MSLALVLSRSRTAVILLVVIFSLFFFLAVKRKGQNKKQKNWIRIFLVSVFIIILFLSFYIGMEETFQRFSLDRISRESRPGIWRNTLKIFSAYPVFGAGLGTFSALFPTMEGDGELAKVTHAHNDFFEYISELGILGAGLFLGGIFILFFRNLNLWRKRKHSMVRSLGLGGIVATVAILLHGLTDFNLHIPANTLLFSVILSLTLVTVTYKPSRLTK
jgi:O-antigen ligase